MRSFIHERGCPASIVVHTFLPRFARAFLSLTSDRSCREISRFVTRALEREDSLDSRVLIGITSDVNEQSLASEGGRVSRCVSASVYFRSRFTAGRTRSSPLAFCPRRTRRRISSARDRERERERERGPVHAPAAIIPSWCACALESGVRRMCGGYRTPRRIASTAAHAGAYQGRAEPTPPSTPRWSRASLGGTGALIPGEFPAGGSARICHSRGGSLPSPVVPISIIRFAAANPFATERHG